MKWLSIAKEGVVKQAFTDDGKISVLQAELENLQYLHEFLSYSMNIKFTYYFFVRYIKIFKQVQYHAANVSQQLS